VLKNYLLLRTLFRRRVIQLDHDARKLLIVTGYLDIEDETDPRFIGGSRNLRLDVFHTDKHAPTIHCPQCGIWHTPVTYPQAPDREQGEVNLAGAGGDGTAGGDNAGGGGGGEAEDEGERKRREQFFPVRKCSELWRTLNEPDIREVARRKAGEGAWKEILSLLKQKAKDAFAKRSTAQAERFEMAAFTLQRIRDMGPNDVLYLGTRQHKAVAELVDPAKFLERLREIDETSQRDQNVSVRNAEAYVDAVHMLELEAARARGQADEMKQVFSYLTGAALDQELVDFKRENEEQVGVATRVLDKMPVSKERGSVRIYSHQELYSQGVLEDDPDKKNHAHAYCCFPIRWFKFLRKTESERMQVLFFDKLQFSFFSTDNDDVFEVKVVFEGQLLKFDLIALSLLMGDSGDPEKQDRARARGVRDDCHRIVYDPQGDPVPVARRQTFEFSVADLVKLLNDFPRPHPREGGEASAHMRAKQLAEALTVDATAYQTT
jgi:hypothetical protein